MAAGDDRGAHSTVEVLLRLLDAPEPPAGAALKWEQWEAVERAALRHGLAPLLYQRLRARVGPAAPPPAVMARLQDVHLHSTLRSVAVRAALGEALDALRRADVGVMVLKGAALADEVYGDASLRPMRDVDLLVRRADLGRTRGIMESLGYASPPEPDAREHHHLPAFVKPGAIPIEVHWSLVRPGLAVEASDDAWASARSTRVAGVEALTLVPDALLHHLCVHVAHGHRFWVPLLHLHDLAAVARRHPDLDWDRLEATARAYGSARFVYAALVLACRSFPAQFPPVARARIARLAHRAEDDRVVALVWEALVAPPRDVPRLLARVRAAPDLAAQAHLLWRHLFPSPARLRLDASFGSRSIPWAYVRRLGALLQRRWHAPLALLFGADGGRGARDHVRRRTVVERWVRGDQTA